MSVVVEHFNRIDWTGKKILIALSGGSDSMVLFHVLLKHNLQFAAVHVNYGLRGAESDADEQFVIRLCEQHHIPLRVFHCPTSLTLNEGKNLQNEARIYRHTLFSQWSNLSSEHIVVLAHHADDQVETFFIQYFRGSGEHGLSGMQTIEHHLYRPFLNLSKSDLIEYARANHIAWREDSSNSSNKYVRNRLRNEILPRLHADIPSLKESIQLFQAKLSESIAMATKKLTKTLTIIRSSNILDFDSWNTLSSLEKITLLKQLQLEPWVLERMDDLIDSEFSAEIITNDLRIIRGQNCFHFSRDLDSKKMWEYKLIDKSVVKNTLTPVLACSEEMPLEQLTVRGLNRSDKIKLPGLSGRKLIWDILKSAGIPKQIRDKHPVVAFQNEIIWVPGFAVSDHPFVKKSNSSTLFITLIEKIDKDE